MTDRRNHVEIGLFDERRHTSALCRVVSRFHCTRRICAGCERVLILMVCITRVYSAVRRLDRRTLRMSDQLPAVFGQLCGIAYYKNPNPATSALQRMYLPTVHCNTLTQVASNRMPAVADAWDRE